MKQIITALFLLQFSIIFSQENLFLPEGIYQTFDDFKNRKVIKIQKPLNIKNKFASTFYTLKDSSGTKIKTNYFGIVQNDTIFIRVNDIQEQLKSNKKVFFASKEFDYIPAKLQNTKELYFEVTNVSKSWKYIRIGVGFFKGIIFNFDTNDFNIFMEQADVENFLKQKNRDDLLKKLSKKKKLDMIEVDKIMKLYFNVE